MIYKITFEDDTIDWCTAKNQLHLIQSYDKDYDLSLQGIESIDEISEEESKAIMVNNTESEEGEPAQISLWELAVGDEFEIIASTEF